MKVKTTILWSKLAKYSRIGQAEKYNLIKNILKKSEYKKDGRVYYPRIVNVNDKDIEFLKIDKQWLIDESRPKYDLMYEGEYIYTKADMVDMLTEIQLEIEELDSRAGYDGNGMPTFSNDYIRKKKVNELIQQKINSLKGRGRS